MRLTRCNGYADRQVGHDRRLGAECGWRATVSQLRARVVAPGPNGAAYTHREGVAPSGRDLGDRLADQYLHRRGVLRCCAAVTELPRAVVAPGPHGSVRLQG